MIIIAIMALVPATFIGTASLVLAGEGEGQQPLTVHEQQAQERIEALLLERLDDAANKVLRIAFKYPENYTWAIDAQTLKELETGDASVDTKVKAIEEMEDRAALADGVDEELDDYYDRLEEFDLFRKVQQK